MRAVFQRVDSASVSVDDHIVSDIGKGLLVYVGVEKGDIPEDIIYLAEKIVNYRIFSDEKGKMNFCIQDIGGEILGVSQFTLSAQVKKGRRPDFGDAEEPVRAKVLYDLFIETIKQYCKVKDGIFGAHMKIRSVNDGPVTFFIEKNSRRK